MKNKTPSPQAAGNGCRPPTTTTMPTALQEHPEFLIRRRMVERILGVGKTTLYKLLAEDPTFPRPVALQPNCRSRRWRRDEVVAYAVSRR